MTNWLKRNFSHAAKIDIAAQGKGQLEAALDEQFLNIFRTIDREIHLLPGAEKKEQVRIVMARALVNAATSSNQVEAVKKYIVGSSGNASFKSPFVP